MYLWNCLKDVFLFLITWSGLVDPEETFRIGDFFRVTTFQAWSSDGDTTDSAAADCAEDGAEKGEKSSPASVVTMGSGRLAGGGVSSSPGVLESAEPRAPSIDDVVESRRREWCLPG